RQIPRLRARLTFWEPSRLVTWSPRWESLPQRCRAKSHWISMQRTITLLGVKVAANAIAECEQLEEDTKGKALTAALIHDLGKLLLAWQMPQEYMKVRHIMEGGMSCIQAEQLVFQGDHAKVGSWVLGLWGLPDA